MTHVPLVLKEYFRVEGRRPHFKGGSELTETPTMNGSKELYSTRAHKDTWR